MGYASALGWFLFVVVFCLTMLQLRFSKRWVHYEGE
jgi:multiple sugar transport system permease protein